MSAVTREGCATPPNTHQNTCPKARNNRATRSDAIPTFVILTPSERGVNVHLERAGVGPDPFAYTSDIYVSNT
jgi:hypothetical protein